MRPPSSASSSGGVQFPAAQQFDPHLPDRFVAGLRNAFHILDPKGTGQIPYELICKKWPIHFSEAPVPANFLDCLRSVIRSDKGLVTFEQFLAGAQLALSKRMENGGHHLKRVQSEGKLLGTNDKEQNEAANRPKSRTSTPSSHPAMGLSGRHKMDPRDFERLARLKRASRSQPQLDQIGGGTNKNPRGLRRTNWLPENKFNFKCVEKGTLDEQLRNDTGDVKIVYRAKKNKAPAPPVPSKQPVVANGNGFPTEMANNNNNNGGQARRPISVASTGNSSTTILPPPSSRMSIANYADELQPQVAKHERLLEEEFEIVRIGAKNAQELLDWYTGRTESLEKRRRMLNKGIVALDSAVHEQKLNFHRAQIAELNRRIKAFLTASEQGFPLHNNIVNNNGISGQQIQPQQQPIRSQVLPPPFPASVPASSSNCSSSSSASSACSPPDSNFSSASEAEFLRAQNQKLMRDIKLLAGEVEQMRLMERRRQQPPILAAVVPPYQHHLTPQQRIHPPIKIGGQKEHPMLWHGMPPMAVNGTFFPYNHHLKTPKDTLL